MAERRAASAKALGSEPSDVLNARAPEPDSAQAVLSVGETWFTGTSQKP